MVPNRCWDARISSILQEGSPVNTGELVISINPQYTITRLEECSSEIQTFTLNAQVNQAKSRINRVRQESEFAEKKQKLITGQLDLALTESGADRRDIRKSELDLKILQTNIEFTREKLESDRKFSSQGFMSPLEIRELESELSGMKNDLESQKIDHDNLRCRPGKFELFKSQSSLRSLVSASFQASREMEFSALSDVVKLQSEANQLQRLKNNFETYQDMIIKCRIKSDVSGIFILPSDNWWGTIAAGSQVWSGMTLGMVINNQEFIIKAKVFDRDIEKVSVSQKVVIFSETSEISGTVSYVSKLAMELYPGVKTYDIRIIPDSSELFLPNQKVRIVLSVAEFSDCFRIPVDLISIKEEHEIIRTERKDLILKPENVKLRDLDYVYYQDQSFPEILNIIPDLH